MTQDLLLAGSAGALTLGLSLALPVAVKPLLLKLGIMDVPNARSSHDRPVLRGLGLAVLLAMTVTSGAAIFFAHLRAPEESSWKFLLVVGAGSLAAGLLGLREDLKGLSVPARSALLLLISIATMAAMLWTASEAFTPMVLAGPVSWEFSQLPAWAVLLLGLYGVLFISGFINVANFMDGLNGISGFHGVIAGLAFASAGWLMGMPWLLTLGLILAGGFAGFLPWNLTKPGAFLGDVGSYLLGGSTAIISLAAFVNGVPLLAAIGPLVIYFGDVVVTLVRRVRAGEKFSEPHKEHAYQRIQQLGYTHVQASAMTAACTLLTSILGLLSTFTSLMGTLLLFIGGLAVLVFYLSLPKLLPVRR